MDHEISLDQAVAMTRLYRATQPTMLAKVLEGRNVLTNCETFDRSAFDRLLAQDNCTQLRIYYGMNEDLTMHAIIIGVDGDGKEILPIGGAPGLLMDGGIRCPSDCPPESPLNP